MTRKLTSIKEGAATLGIGESTLRYYITLGTVKTVKLGGRRLVPTDELARIAEQGFTAESTTKEPAK